MGRTSGAVGRRWVVAAMAPASNRVRFGARVGWAALALAVASGAAADVATPPTDPSAFVVSAGGNLYVGNATRVPGPVGANGSLLLDERVRVPLAVARRDVKMRLLAQVDGDLLSVGGAVQLANQVHVGGTLMADRDVVVGVSARVDGDVVATEGGVRVVRLASVSGDVYADHDFRGDRDVVVGSPGSRVEVRGDAVIRDRSEYFAAIAYEGTLSVLGVGEPVFHASVTAMAPGTLVAPSMPSWKLESAALPSADPGPDDVTITKTDGPVALAPGRYRVVTLGQEARLVLSPGVYELDQLVAQSDARIAVTLPGPSDAVELRVRRDVKPGRRVAMDLGTTDATLRRDRAGRIRTVAGGVFRGDQDVVWAGAIVAAKNVTLGKHTTLRGSVWSKGDVQVGRDGVLEWVPAAVN
jgi:predicted acyltransferase (DUF342 family)